MAIFQDGHRHHPGFLKLQIFNGRDAEERQAASPCLCQISSKSRKPISRFSKMVTSAILDFYFFLNLTVRTVNWSNCVSVPNFVEIGRIAAEIWRLFDFSRWRPPPFWIFKTSNF